MLRAMHWETQHETKYAQRKTIQYFKNRNIFCAWSQLERKNIVLRWLSGSGEELMPILYSLNVA